MTFLSEEENRKFLGTGEKNAGGMTLQEFLEAYNPKKYDSPCSTVDNLIFEAPAPQIQAGCPVPDRVLLIKRRNHPSIGWWALPGGFVEVRENLDTAAARELAEETGLTGLVEEQMRTYGDVGRDPRTRIITTAYIALVPDDSVKEKAGDDAKDAGWFSIERHKLSEKEDAGMRKQTWELILRKTDGDVTTHTEIEVTERTDTFLKNRQYKVVKTDLLASDHGAVILEGLDYIAARIRG
ncbi:MAG: NUDIX domain-containing protein [Lachnospiraceae bacterium]|jgi:8-oxo-dGTP diphosphatase